MFLSVSDKTDEVYIGATRGMVKARAIRRLVACESCNPEYLMSLTAWPWDGPVSAGPVRVILPEVELCAPLEESTVVRRVYIMKQDLETYGYTEGCKGCKALAAGTRPQAHTEGCRARIEAELAKTDEGRERLTRSYLRGLQGADGGDPDQGAIAAASSSSSAAAPAAAASSSGRARICAEKDG